MYSRSVCERVDFNRWIFLKKRICERNASASERVHISLKQTPAKHKAARGEAAVKAVLQTLAFEVPPSVPIFPSEDRVAA